MQRPLKFLRLFKELLGNYPLPEPTNNCVIWTKRKFRKNKIWTSMGDVLKWGIVGRVRTKSREVFLPQNEITRSRAIPWPPSALRPVEKNLYRQIFGNEKYHQCRNISWNKSMHIGLLAKSVQSLYCYLQSCVKFHLESQRPKNAFLFFVIEICPYIHPFWAAIALQFLPNPPSF